MSSFFRKSINLGGVRMNLSKSGVGFSTGIKGLRVGVNSSGKSYVSGGSNGFYFREYGNSPEQYGRKKAKITDDALFSEFLICTACCAFIIGLLPIDPILIGISIVIFLCGIIYIVRKKVLKKKFEEKIEKLGNEVESAINNSNYNRIVDIINYMESEEIPEEYIVLVLDGVYKKFIEEAVKDKKISADENNVINALSRYMTEEKFVYLNELAVNMVVCDVLNDNIITADEEKALAEIISVLKISDEKRENVNRILVEYRKIREILNRKLEPISVSNGIPCYYRSNIDMLSRRKGNYTYYEYDTIGSGTIEIYADFVELIVEGDKRIKINDIMDLSTQGERLHMIIKNRKTPIYLKSEEPAYIIAIISKLKAGR